VIADMRPWSRLALRRVIVAQGIALVLGVIAWSGANAQDGIRTQIAWLNLAILAAILAGTAQAWWLLMGRRVVTLQRRAALAQRGATERTAVGSSAMPPAGRPSLLQRVAIAGSAWHHDPSCLLVKGKEVLALGSIAGLEPCDVCRR
jgi:hypothetical protein